MVPVSARLGAMNYLAHLHLGGREPQQLLGSLYGDFVKVRCKGASRRPSRLRFVCTAISTATPTATRWYWRRWRAFPVSGGVLPGSSRMCFRPLPGAALGRLRRTAAERLHRRLLPRTTRRAGTARAAGAYRPVHGRRRLAGRLWRFRHAGAGVSRYRPAVVTAGRHGRGDGELEVLYEPLLADFREFYPQLQAFALASR